MKKIFLLFMSLAVLSSCSNDDDASGNSEDQILGTWYLAEVNGTGSLPFEVNECTSQSNITFGTDNTAFSEYYMQTQAGCTVDAEEGTWNDGEGSKYSFRIPYLGSQEGTVEFSEDGSQFTFYPDRLQNPDSEDDPNIVFEKR